MPGSIGRRLMSARKKSPLRVGGKKAKAVKPPFEEAVEKAIEKRGPTREKRLKEWVERGAEIKEIEKRLEEDKRFRKNWTENFDKWDKMFKDYKKKAARKGWKKMPFLEKWNILSLLLNKAMDLFFFSWGYTSPKRQKNNLRKSNKIVLGELEKQLDERRKEYAEIRKKYEAL